MLFKSIASNLNLRQDANINSLILGELNSGDIFEADNTTNPLSTLWVKGTVKTGIYTGMIGYVRRKWIIQSHKNPITLPTIDRKRAGEIIAQRTAQFDHIKYGLGSRAASWSQLSDKIDCSGWVSLLLEEITQAYSLTTKAGKFFTYSDEQVTRIGSITKTIISGKQINLNLLQAGCVIGLDNAEYNWDRNRPLDIDHIVIVGEDSDGKFISQSSSSGSGVNRTSLDKWFSSQNHLIESYRIHLVDALSLP